MLAGSDRACSPRNRRNTQVKCRENVCPSNARSLRRKGGFDRGRRYGGSNRGRRHVAWSRAHRLLFRDGLIRCSRWNGGRRGCRWGWTHEVRSPSRIGLRLEFPTVTSGLSCRRSRCSDFESVFSHFGTDLVHALLSFLRLGGIRLLLDYLIIINVGGLVILLLVVEFRDVVRIIHIQALQRLQVVLSLRHFFAVRISQQKIFERFLCAHSGGLVITGLSTRLEVNIADLIHRVWCDIAIRVSINDPLVSIDGCGDRAAFFKSLANAELS